MLGYCFQPRPNGRVLSTAGSVMTIGLSINGLSHSKKTQFDGDLKGLTRSRQSLPFSSLLKKTKGGSARRMLSDFLASKTVLVQVKIKNVLHSFEKNKTPAEDGFSKKFYETFFDHLKQNLLDSYNEAFQKGSLSVSQRRGVISLKNDCDLSELTGWRPITFFYFLPCINVVNLLSIKTYFTRVL